MPRWLSKSIFLSNTLLLVVGILLILPGYNGIGDGDEVFNIFQERDVLEKRYGHFPEELRLEMVRDAKEMFYFGYDNYMKHAFPLDELNPLHCSGRGPDVDNPSNLNINDVLGDYSLSLVESLDALALLGNVTEFHRAVSLVTEFVNFDKNTTVQVFEATIRILGSLLSAHLLIVDPLQPFGQLKPSWYSNQLLDLAQDLGSRLLPAFEETPTGLPFPRVNLRNGVPLDCSRETCTAGAGSLLLEFGLLSRLSGDPVYEAKARRVNKALWSLKSAETGLFGNVVNVDSGAWVGSVSGVGAGVDSFYEYMLKSYILFGEEEDWKMFNESYTALKKYLRRGRRHCNEGLGDPPLYVNVDMKSGETATPWIDAMQAAFSGVQALWGDIQEAICAHALYYFVWRRFGVLPERFNWQRIAPEVRFYPLRPELIESTYALYQVTKSPFYLHVGREIMTSLNAHTRAKCGFATVHDVRDMSLEDRMESFFLAETAKYLYLLFDRDHYVNVNANDFLFSTEGHIFRIQRAFRDNGTFRDAFGTGFQGLNTNDSSLPATFNCPSISDETTWLLPLRSRYMAQLETIILGESSL
ncbi:unnamed protein product [Cyprideis torosa]|uniref:alpha-1,2-Mannosidase n=1 Tax=Cyprideis torosa TaxID=163714 RepID=A0A7R8ZPX2_9CRUS|nr:unnamed protein product [Cyprideis torosa]CAG0894992.1 unnamed protein product [Cyprideis torosa]